MGGRKGGSPHGEDLRVGCRGGVALAGKHVVRVGLPLHRNGYGCGQRDWPASLVGWVWAGCLWVLGSRPCGQAWVLRLHPVASGRAAGVLLMELGGLCLWVR